MEISAFWATHFTPIASISFAVSQSGCIYISKGTACPCNGCIYQFMIFHFIRNQNISQTFTWKGERFGPGVAYECVAVIVRQVWNYGAVKYDFTVWFVCNEINRMSQLC